MSRHARREDQPAPMRRAGVGYAKAFLGCPCARTCAARSRLQMKSDSWMDPRLIDAPERRAARRAVRRDAVRGVIRARGEFRTLQRDVRCGAPSPGASQDGRPNSDYVTM